MEGFRKAWAKTSIKPTRSVDIQVTTITVRLAGNPGNRTLTVFANMAALILGEPVLVEVQQPVLGPAGVGEANAPR